MHTVPSVLGGMGNASFTHQQHRANRMLEMMTHIKQNHRIEDHRNLDEWSYYANGSTLEYYEMPIDMRFNSGHLLSIMVYSTLMVFSAMGNITVLSSLAQRKGRASSRINIMLAHLAIADLLVTFLMMPLEIGWAYTVRWSAGDLMCRVMAFFRTFGLYLSSFILICISIDRYYAVLKPLKVHDHHRARLMISTAWIMSGLCSLPQSFIFHLERHPNITVYEQCVTYHFFEEEVYEIIYNVLGMCFMYALPLVVILYCYGSIYYEIFSRTNPRNLESFRRSSIDVLGRAKRKTLRMTITIVIVFVVCWTPYYVMSLWYWLDKESAKNVDQRIQKGLFLFASTNSCMNPVVYGIYNVRKERPKNKLKQPEKSGSNAIMKA
ncbi:adipokinetic hormone/corazonin-related peptide receptor variant I [Anopheles bellator]|uniref:adipokinetic hormone/corazonin-related peptide receptor variant I n=1 Tax=Anopheles bellator TaxID=139047 RepID=UPI002649B4C7|nr:adipokinetic hormone/corazonin-related peptide receptor variant I [Anopheles bellator]